MSKNKNKISRANPVGKTTGETARRLRALGWKDKEIAKMPPKTKSVYLKYGNKPQAFSLTERVTQTRTARKPGPATKNTSEYSAKKLSLKSRRFNEPATIDGKKNRNYIPLKDKDKDLSDLRQKRAASKEGGPKLTKAETLYLEKLTRWNVGSGRRKQGERESVFYGARRKISGGVSRAKQEMAKKEERLKIEEERDAQYKEGISGNIKEAKEGSRSLIDRAARIEKRKARQYPGGEATMKKLGIGTEDVPKFGKDFRKSRDLDRKEELEKIELKQLKQLEKEEEAEAEKAEKKEEKPKRYGRYVY